MFNFIKNKIIKEKTWKHIEYFDERWKDRIQLMSSYIPSNTTVLDLGCGKEWLKEYLPNDCHYIGVDYTTRSENTIISEFNLYEFPEIIVDMCFVSGCLEYVKDYNWFVKKIAEVSNFCLLSYCCTDHFSDLRHRKQRNWVNHLSKSDLVKLFNTFNFQLKEHTITETNNSILLFKKSSI